MQQLPLVVNERKNEEDSREREGLENDRNTSRTTQ